MRRRSCARRRTAATALGAILALLLAPPGSASAAEPAGRPLVVAHYMPWFAAKPFSPQWGWHWTMNAFDPDQVTAGKRQIASHYTPLIGPYDSGDPAVIEYHLLLMKLAGLDGAIVDWYGLSDFLDYAALHRNTQALFERAAQLGVQVGICYEDQTIPRLVEAKRLPASDRVKHAQGEIEWLRANWFARPTYLKLSGAPVLLSFGFDGLSDAEWEQVFPATASAPLYLSEHRRRTAAKGSFDWPQPQTGLAGLDTYYQAAKDPTGAGSVCVPVAFPRFHDIYKEGKAQAGYAQIPDDLGRTFTSTFERAVQSGAPLLQIATWNDWGEGTNIEPSTEFGYRDLEAIQKERRSQDPRFLATPDDLRLPLRLWRLRGRPAPTPPFAAELDRIAVQLAGADAAGARAALVRLEAPAPPGQ